MAPLCMLSLESPLFKRTHMHAHTCACPEAHTEAHEYKSNVLHACTGTHAQTNMHTHTHAKTCMHMHTYIIHSHARMNIHTYATHPCSHTHTMHVHAPV